jgi:hypothetical protein
LSQEIFTRTLLERNNLSSVGAVMKKTALELTVMLALSLSAATAVQTTKSLPSEDLFNVDLLYAYVQPGAPSAVAVLNFTTISNLTLPSNSGIIEVYTIRVFSKGATVGSKGAIGGAIGLAHLNGSFLMALGMGFGTFSSSEGGGIRFFEAPYEPLNPSLVEPISLSVVRLGWITIEGNSTQTQLYLNETVKHVELSKYQNGYLYNTLFSQDELAQIDPFDPVELTNTPSPSPTPTPTPYEEPTSFPTLLVIASASTVVAVCAGLGLLAYFKKRKH